LKKASLFLLMGLCLILLVCPVYAVYGASDKVEISFKVGDDTLIINATDVKVEKPFVTNGVTLVPLRVLTEAFGAEVNWDSEEQSITLNYNDRIIKLYINKKEVTVDGEQAVLLEAPIINNNITMVPLRFITENFGAEVKYDDKTAQISVTKEIAGDNSIKDYALILKKTTKSKVGDSFYGWSINYPKGLKISDRFFEGTYTDFVADDQSYGIRIVIWKQDEETLEGLLAEEQEDNQDITLISQRIENKDGVKYAKTVSKDEEYVYDVRYFIKGERVFMVFFYSEDYDKYKDDTTYTDILDSFRTNFIKDDAVEDLSDINAEGYRTYIDKDLKYSLNILPDWCQWLNEDQPNEVKFFPEGGQEINDSINVNMYSRPIGFTNEMWANNMLQMMKDDNNPDYYKILKQEDGEINGVKCKKIYYTQDILGETLYSCDIFIMGENYKYNVFYHVKEDTYNDKQKLDKIERAINSFEFTEPDPDKIGSLLDPYDVQVLDNIVKRSSSKNKWSVKLPANWIAVGDSNDEDVVAYRQDLKGISIVVKKGITLEYFIPYFQEEVDNQEQLGIFELNKKEKLNDKGTVVYKYSLTVKNEGLEMMDDAYILSKNGNLYIVDIMCPKYNLSKKNIETLEDIWDSMKFE